AAGTRPTRPRSLPARTWTWWSRPCWFPLVWCGERSAVPERRYRDLVDVDVAGRAVNLSSPDKVMFPEPGLTKLDVVDFYRRVELPLMTAIRGRPVLMQRFPSGVDGSNFFQKRVPKERPD